MLGGKKILNWASMLLVSLGIACGDTSEENSLEQICSADRDCPGEELCQNNLCINSQETRTVGGAEITVKEVQSNGEVNFYGITVGLRDEQGRIIHNPAAATVLYFNHPSFDCFVAEHPEYVHAPQCVDSLQYFKDNNPAITLSLTSAPLQIFHPENYSSEENDLRRFDGWLQENGRYMGCWDKEQLVTTMLDHAFILKVGSSIFSGGLASNIANSVISAITSRLTEEWNEDDVADIYVLIPREYGFPATTTITTLEVRRQRTGEVCGDNNNNNNDNNNNNNNNSTETLGDCDLPGCVRFNSYDSCQEPCFHDGYRCLLPCSSDNDCPTTNGFNLRCINTDDGNACLLPECQQDSDCLPSEICIDARDYDIDRTASGSMPLAASVTIFNTCYPIECLE